MHLNPKYIEVRTFSFFITSNYPNIDKDDLTIISEGYSAKVGNIDDYDALIQLLHDKNLDLSATADYQELLGYFDEDNYIDYMILMIYSGNNDWINSNLRTWKENKSGGKWRWMLDDVDSGFEIDNVNLNQFSELSNVSSPAVMNLLFESLTKNTEFKQKFKTRFLELLDTTFAATNVISVVDAIVDERKDYIALETPKWNSVTIGAFDLFVSNVKDFVNQRNAIVRSQLLTFIP